MKKRVVSRIAGKLSLWRMAAVPSFLLAAALLPAAAFAGNVKDFDGLYKRAGNGGNLAVEGVPFNDADVLNVFLDGIEYRPVRQADSLASFVYREEDCVIAFTPYAADGGRQGMYVETVPGATCKGEGGKELPDYKNNYVRDEKPEAIERYDAPQ